MAKQRLPGKPTDLRQFPDHSLPGAFFLEAKNHIENRATSETVWAQFIFWCGKFELLSILCGRVDHHRCKYTYIRQVLLPSANQSEMHS